MANVAYALLVRDVASGVDRSRIDDALAGRVTIRPADQLTEVSPYDGRPDAIPPLPQARDMEDLREQWGRTPEAIREKLKFDATMKTLPRQG